jgi:hypothetical protein
VSDRDYSKIGQSNQQLSLDSNLDVDELHMRETLGLTGRTRPQIRAQPASSPMSAKQRHRFVQDGEVPVIHLAPGSRDSDNAGTLRARIASLEASLEQEQSARSKAEHSLQASLTHSHALETKLAHVEMAARETLTAERSLREHAEFALQAAIQERDTAMQQAAARELSVQIAAAAPPSVELPEVKERPKRAPRVAKPKVPRATTPRIEEPQPIKWWLNSAKAKPSKR